MAATEADVSAKAWFMRDAKNGGDANGQRLGAGGGLILNKDMH